MKSEGDSMPTNSIIEIRIPKGFHALPIGSISSHPDEEEGLLNRNQKFEVVGTIENRNGYTYVWKAIPTDNIKQNEIYLNEVSNHYVKLSANCKQEEKVVGEHPCSGNDNEQPKQDIQSKWSQLAYRDWETAYDRYKKITK